MNTLQKYVFGIVLFFAIATPVSAQVNNEQTVALLKQMIGLLQQQLTLMLQQQIQLNSVQEQIQPTPVIVPEVCTITLVTNKRIGTDVYWHSTLSSGIVTATVNGVTSKIDAVISTTSKITKVKDQYFGYIGRYGYNSTLDFVGQFGSATCAAHYMYSN